MGTTPIDALIFTLIFVPIAALFVAVLYYLTLPERIPLQGSKMVKTKKNNPGCQYCKYKRTYQITDMFYEETCILSARKDFNYDGEFFAYTECIELNDNLECTNFKPNLFTKIFRKKLLKGYLND